MRFFLRLLLGAVIGCGLGLVARRVFGSFSASAPSQAVSSAPVHRDAPQAASLPSPSVSPGESNVLADSPHPTGYLTFRGKINVVMSDGTIRTERDSELGVVERNSVTLEGKKLFIRARGKAAGHPDLASSPAGSAGAGVSPVSAERVAPSRTSFPDLVTTH